ncbi:hypothetical protein NP493_330g04014 [Ridgeia piscesae]|uniref:Uncharacterized protein n=1 Tax=Ridgeia piscesae TaxID=27915 RepID=A0AAD9L408_RIDPI|nr:hypothetical protein NP493_330g04014 [Ridgeia piscesae]
MYDIIFLKWRVAENLANEQCAPLIKRILQNIITLNEHYSHLDNSTTRPAERATAFPTIPLGSMRRLYILNYKTNCLHVRYGNNTLAQIHAAPDENIRQQCGFNPKRLITLAGHGKRCVHTSMHATLQHGIRCLRPSDFSKMHFLHILPS